MTAEGELRNKLIEVLYPYMHVDDYIEARDPALAARLVAREAECAADALLLVLAAYVEQARERVLVESAKLQIDVLERLGRPVDERLRRLAAPAEEES